MQIYLVFKVISKNNDQYICCYQSEEKAQAHVFAAATRSEQYFIHQSTLII